jgi:DNA-binding MarR family transcriptional regulator
MSNGFITGYRSFPMSIPAHQAALENNTRPLIRIGTMLKELATFVDGAAGNDTGNRSFSRQRSDATMAVPAATVGALIETRKARGALFPKNWFSDPAWDILLFLYRAHLSNDRITVGNISEGCDSRPTTTIRWVDILESYKLVTRQRCKLDSRRAFIELTGKGVDAMNSYFSNISNIG